MAHMDLDATVWLHFALVATLVWALERIWWRPQQQLFALREQLTHGRHLQAKQWMEQSALIEADIAKQWQQAKLADAEQAANIVQRAKNEAATLVEQAKQQALGLWQQAESAQLAEQEQQQAQLPQICASLRGALAERLRKPGQQSLD